MVVATSTLTSFLSNVFSLGLDTMLWLLGVIWPYLITIAVVYIFWKIGRSFFRGR